MYIYELGVVAKQWRYTVKKFYVKANTCYDARKFLRKLIPRRYGVTNVYGIKIYNEMLFDVGCNH